MAELDSFLKLFIGFPLTGELKGALRRHPEWETQFIQTDMDGQTHIGSYIEKREIDPKEVEEIAAQLEKKLSELVPEIILHLPKIVIFPQVLIT